MEHFTVIVTGDEYDLLMQAIENHNEEATTYNKVDFEARPISDNSTNIRVACSRVDDAFWLGVEYTRLLTNQKIREIKLY